MAESWIALVPALAAIGILVGVRLIAPRQT